MSKTEATAQKLMELVKSCGATHTAQVAYPQIVFAEELREMCAMNSCGHFDKCWVCPPALAPVAEWREKLASFDGGLLIQTVYQLEDSLDYEGMMAAKDQHSQTMRAIGDALCGDDSFDSVLLLGAGACDICASCTYPDAPCRFPEKALVSVEACGIDVNKTLVNCSLHYNNGPDTVSYVGMLLFR